ncbi:MAG: GNAT family N-acetyltransferase [Streptosporangiaceae bacterium]
MTYHRLTGGRLTDDQLASGEAGQNEARLDRPAAAVRASYLAGMRAICAEDGTSAAWLDEASEDFGRFAAGRAALHRMWEVPVTELWYTRESDYLGTVVIRHKLTPPLLHDGGNIGYHVVPGHRRQGHATAMLAAACNRCRDSGMSRVLLTCQPENLASRRVIEANGGVLDSADDLLRYWIAL